MPIWDQSNRAQDSDPFEWDVSDAVELPDLADEDLMQTATCYREACGLGWDRFHPKWLRQLPRSYRLRLLGLLKAFEREPMRLDLLLLISVFLGKPSGGHRHIIWNAI